MNPPSASPARSPPLGKRRQLIPDEVGEADLRHGRLGYMLESSSFMEVVINGVSDDGVEIGGESVRERVRERFRRGREYGMKLGRGYFRYQRKN